MSKKRSRIGFTLVELMVALVLFSTLGVVGFNFLKDSMNSTLKQKTQQAANENAKNLLKIITNDLKSSSVMNYKIPFINTGRLAYNYPSSVIFPATNQFSTTGINSANYSNNAEDVMSFSHEGGASGVNTMRSNQNRLIFYTKSLLDASSSNNVIIQIVEYKTVFENGKCRVDRIDYNVRTSTNNLTEWPAISLLNGMALFSIDGLDVEFNHNSFSNLNVRNTNTLLSLPNTGDVVLLYVNRAFVDTNLGRRFAPNQYNVKIMVFQTIRDIDLDFFEEHTENGDTYFTVNQNFTNLFIHDEDNDTNIRRKRIRDNYRYAELSSSVGVFAPSSN